MKFMFSSFFSLVFCCVTTIVFSEPTTIRKIMTEGDNKGIHVHILLSQSTHYHSFSLSDPPRLVIDINNTKPIKVALPTFSEFPWLRQLRVAPRSEDQQRMVFEFTEAVKSQVALNSPLKKNGNWDLDIALNAPVALGRQAAEESDKKTRSVIKTADAHEASYRCVNIVIDPGHGGADPGAVSVHGVKEKQVTLAISKYLADLINHTAGMCAYLTRTTDTFVSLRGRINFARAKSADMLIAIHADMFNNKEARGATVFALSQRGATSEAARWIAHKENASDFIDVGESDEKNKDLQSILMNITQNETVNRSLILGKDILVNLDAFSKLHHTIVEQAGFVVLKSPDIPSVLVETGFLSNAYEEKQLSDSVYQKKIALAIYRGIMKYTQQYSFALLNKQVDHEDS